MGGFGETLRQLGPLRLSLLGAVAVGLLGFFFFFSMRLSQPPMGLLYSDLAPQDAAQITARLDQQQIPFELRNGGNTIMVPDDRVLRLRLSFAEAGIPRGGSIGYEIFDRGEALGQTNFMQQLNQVRALEGELARTISALQPVQNARVHLVVPRRDLFNRERQEPTASVIIRMRDANNRLPRQQVQAIQSLVAAAVPGLRPVRVSVIDDRGNLLARGQAEGDDPSALNNSAEELRRGYEQRLSRTIETVLERVVGPGKARAEVSIDLDFDRIVTNKESFDPDGQVVRSTQTVSENNEASEQAAQVTVQNNLPDSGQDSGGPRTTNRGTRTEETDEFRNHQDDDAACARAGRDPPPDRGRAGRRQCHGYGRPTPVAAALGRGNAAPDGVGAQRRGFRPAPRRPRPNSSICSSTRPEELPVETTEPGLFDFSKQDIMRIAEVFVMAIVALLVILLVARPIINHVLKSAQEKARTGTRGGRASGGASPAAARCRRRGPALWAAPPPAWKAPARSNR